MMELLLDRSGYMLQEAVPGCLENEVEEMVLSVVKHRLTFDELVTWFKTRIAQKGV